MNETTCDSPEPHAEVYDMDEEDLREALLSAYEDMSSLFLKVEGLERERNNLFARLGRREKKIQELEAELKVAKP